MGNFIDLTGKKFGKLTVIRKTSKDKYNHMSWLCLCDCGNTDIVLGGNLRGGYIKSCGCSTKEFQSMMLCKYKSIGGSHTKIYKAWRSMIDRCVRPNCTGYKNYGGRGITVCKEWGDYETFHKWAIIRFSIGLQLDRVNNEGNYEPENCEFVTPTQNMSHTRKTRYLTLNGETHSTAEWVEKCKIKDHIMRYWLRKGNDSTVLKIQQRIAELSYLAIPSSSLTF